MLELLLRQNIDKGLGATLLDPSDEGDTMYKVLKYAIRKGHEKILLIDPHDVGPFDAVPVLQPLHVVRDKTGKPNLAYAAAIVGGLMDTSRILWDTKSFADTPRIQKFMPAVLTALYAAGMTMAEVRYFLDMWTARNRREHILSHLSEYDVHRQHIESAFKTVSTFEHFQSTINRLMPFIDPTLELMFGSNDNPIDFKQLISQGYLILVNLDPEGMWGVESPEQRLLGTVVINEITYAIHRLRVNGWSGKHYLYIDEAGDYATPKLSFILDKKRKSGLRLTLSHQGFDQFKDREVLAAVYRGTKIKVLFNTASREDRDKMIRMMYGGDLTDREVSYTLMSLKKQNCVIKNNKQPPQGVRLQDIPDVEMSGDELGEWKENFYKSSPFYRKMATVRAEINARFDGRFTTQRPRTGGSPARTRNDSRTTSPAETDGQARPRVKTVFSKTKREAKKGSVQPDQESAE